MVESKENSLFINLLKGIGILWVVSGHAGLFHYTDPVKNAGEIAVFFWVAGYTYNFSKYGNNVPQLIGNRVHKFFGPYLGYMILLLFCHNLFFDWGMFLEYETVKYMTMQDYFYALCNYWTLSYEALCGALWFMSPFLISVMIYGNVTHFVGIRYQEQKKYWLWLTVVSCALGLLGIVMVENGVVAHHRGELACLMIPVIATGNMANEFRLIHTRLFNAVGGIISVAVIYLVYHITGKIVIFASNELIHPALFYVCVFCGIYFIAWMAKILMKWKVLKYIRQFLNLLGKYSMDIMTMHIVFFRMLFAWYRQTRGGEEYIMFVEEHSIACFVVGLTCPILLRWGAHIIYQKFLMIYIRKG